MKTFRKYLLPGFVFQSVVIAGGYGTGRELAEFFLKQGPLSGLLSMVLVSTVVWSAVSAASFEFARLFRSYDYRSFFTHLLGKGWFLFEICYVSMMLIVLAVIAAAAGSFLEATSELSYEVGVTGMMLAIGYLVFRGTGTIEKVMASWSFVLYGVYIIFFALCFRSFGRDIVASFGSPQIGTAMVVDGVRYASYNLAIIPAILFCLRHIETRKEAISAGLLVGPIGMIPAILFFVAMTGYYPEILELPVPANFLLEALGSRTFQLAFQIVLFGTLIETGTGMIHAVNERLASVYQEKNLSMPDFLRPTVAVGFLVMGWLLSKFGLIDLIAKGYGTITWAFLAIFVAPILTLGIWKIRVEARRLIAADERR